MSGTASLLTNITVTGNVITQTMSGNVQTPNGFTVITPISLATGQPQVIFAAGGQYLTSLVMNDGTVRVCGRNTTFGQLGQNDLINRSTVVLVVGISSQAIAVACGGNHMAILVNDGTVRTCGQNLLGQLGINDLTNRSTVVTVIGISSQAIAVACGAYHTAILLNNGTVRTCGRDNFGQLGANTLATTRSTIVAVVGISSQAIAVACGRYHTAVLMNNGTVRVCGNNQYGQLGQNDLQTTRSTVVSVLNVTTAIGVACGAFHTAIVLSDGTVRVCGRDDFGQLGLNTAQTTRSTIIAVLNVTTATAITCGWYHTSILLRDGTVRTCGLNLQGQLGQNDTNNRSTVVPVVNVSTAIAVANGRSHSTITLNDGTVVISGLNNSGQLGVNDTVIRSTVVPTLNISAARSVSSAPAKVVASGGYHNAIILNDGTVRTCGRNTEGQLGVNDIVNRSTIVSVIGISSQAIAVAGGRYYTAILINDGTVRVCGRDDFGQLGLNDLTNRSTVVSVLNVTTAIGVACGWYHTAILLNNGTVRTCGMNNFGQLGLNDQISRSTVVSVLNVTTAIGVTCNKYDTAILLNNGTIRACGDNFYGQLGSNDSTSIFRSTVVPVFGISSQAIAISYGFYHATVLINNGTVKTYGRNTEGQLGINDLTNRATAVSILGIQDLVTSGFCYTKPGVTIKSVSSACANYQTAILLDDGTVRACGQNTLGQLGTNDRVTRSTLVPVIGISSQAIAVSCGFTHTAILLNDGTVRVCGRNNSGQLGQNNILTYSTVVSVIGISSQAIAVACGSLHTAILLNNGSVRVCGLNGNGQLGVNDIVNRSTVVSVLNVTTAIAVACGWYHTAILLNNGTVRTCGRNTEGQLGINDLTNRSTVVSVIGISSQAIAVACGRNHTAILLNSGTVRICGANNSGQLGLNDLTNRSTIVSVLNVTTAIAVACGSYHMAILLRDGTVRTCGRSTGGQLGVNDLITRSTVVSLLNVSTASTISCGVNQTTIVLVDGTVRLCGNNGQAQLGMNDTVTRSSVVPLPGLFGLYLLMNALALSVPAPSYQLDLSTDNARKLSSTTWYTGSDERIKSDIQTANLERCSEIIDSLDLKYFGWSPEIQTNDRHSLGWIAQDVEKFFPNSVRSAPAHGIDDFKNLNSDQLIKVMYGSLKNMIQKTYPPTEVVNELSIQGVSSPVSDPVTTDPQTS